MEVRPLTQTRWTDDQIRGARSLASAVIRQAYEDARDADECEGVLQFVSSPWFVWWCDAAGIDHVLARRKIEEIAMRTALAAHDRGRGGDADEAHDYPA